ncbi:MAG: hypothetical protein WC552_06155 [Candidatus Omnitrophota bacterium]
MRFIIPACPAFNIYSTIARKTTALGPVGIAGVVNKRKKRYAEASDENNLLLYGVSGGAAGPATGSSSSYGPHPIKTNYAIYGRSSGRVSFVSSRSSSQRLPAIFDFPKSYDKINSVCGEVGAGVSL